MTYRDLYDALSQLELRNVALRARLSVEDVRQEALLCCWQIACGRSDYDAHCGSARRYVMAKLWGLAARQTELRTVPLADADADDDGEAARLRRRAVALCASPSVLDVIIDREERQHADRRLQVPLRDTPARYASVSSTALLMEHGISSVRIAALTGVTPQAVRQRVARERARPGAARAPRPRCERAGRRAHD